MKDVQEGEREIVKEEKGKGEKEDYANRKEAMKDILRKRKDKRKEMKGEKR